MKVLPAKKAARYVQIENEFRVLLKYHLAATVLFVEYGTRGECRVARDGGKIVIS